MSSLPQSDGSDPKSLVTPGSADCVGSKSSFGAAWLSAGDHGNLTRYRHFPRMGSSFASSYAISISATSCKAKH